MTVPMAELGAPRMRGPEPPGTIAREVANHALKASLWLAIDAADRCGDGESSDQLLALYDRHIKRMVRG